MNSLVGRYRLKSHGIYAADGTFKPTSPYLKGEIAYGSDGHLSVLMLFKETPETAKDIFGYVGTYKIISDKVVEHHFSVSTVPSRHDAIEERTYLIKEDELRLGAVMSDGQRFEAVWIRSGTLIS